MATTRKIVIPLAIIVAVAIGVAIALSAGGKTGVPAGGGMVTLVIGGATFPAMQLDYWIKQFRHRYPNISITYQPVGSGKGMANLLAGVYAIAFHDPPLPSRIWEKAVDKYEAVLQCPTVVGAVVIIYNIPEIRGHLNLTGKLLADIFMGKIQDWCHPEVLKYNPELARTCEHKKTMPITVVVRKDASGTTYIFTSYLSKISQEFKNLVGAALSPKWDRAWSKYHLARAVEAEGNDGVAITVAQTQYAIGYVEWAYAFKAGLEDKVARLQTPLGTFVLPNYTTIYRAVETAIRRGLLEKFNPLSDLSKAGIIDMLLNVPDERAYPVVSFSFLTVRLRYTKDELNKAIAIYLFLKHIWVDKPYSEHVEKGYVLVPRELRELCFNVLRKNIKVDNTPIVKLLANRSLT